MHANSVHELICFLRHLHTETRRHEHQRPTEATHQAAARAAHTVIACADTRMCVHVLRDFFARFSCSATGAAHGAQLTRT